VLGAAGELSDVAGVAITDVAARGGVPRLRWPYPFDQRAPQQARPGALAGALELCERAEQVSTDPERAEQARLRASRLFLVGVGIDVLRVGR
jgi:hypothetical protein